tara:strand:+ start:5187 stop:5537 length:351 start_codon:yes stop_codon:yes gene_type:complete
MQAKATKRGFYDQRLIEAGDVFHLKDKAAFSDKWMEPVDFKPDEKPTDETPSDISDDDIKAAVGMLDHANDGHWTAKGEPAMAAIEALVGSDKITRADVERAVGKVARVIPNEETA